MDFDKLEGLPKLIYAFEKYESPSGDKFVYFLTALRYTTCESLISKYCFESLLTHRITQKTEVHDGEPNEWKNIR